MTTSTPVTAAVPEATRLLAVGRQWLNDDGSTTIVMDGDMPTSINLGPNARLITRPNNQREGKRDAQNRVFIRVTQSQFDEFLNAKDVAAQKRAGQAALV